MKNFARKDIEKRRIAIKLINLDEFYNGKKELNRQALKTKIISMSPSILLISVCYSEILDLRFVLEMEGIFPSLKLQGDLRLATNGKQLELDPVQTNLLYTVARIIQKVTIMHGPEGSGK